MRTLQADLTSEQEKSSYTPYMEVKLSSRDRATIRTYKTDDSTNRVLRVQQVEARFGGEIAVPDSLFPISVIIQLQDSDQVINILDFKGYRADISWGLEVSTLTDAQQVSIGPPVFIVEQKSVSLEGQLIVELYGISMWAILRNAWAKQTETLRIEFNADVSVRHIIMDLLGGQSFTLDSEATFTGAVQLDDGGVFTDHTADAIDPTDGSNLGSTNDVDLLPATPAVNDAFYVGHTDQFEHISIDMTTVGVGTWTILWEYWNGSSWATITGLVDNTTGFTVGALKTVVFTKPTNWATSTENSKGPFYYVRGRVTVFSAVTTQPKATKVVVHHDFSISLDSSDSGQGDDDKPRYASDFGQDVATTVQDILANSLLTVRAENDGFHLIFVDDSVSSVDYTYGGDHDAFAASLRDALIVPNNIIYTNLFPGETGTRFEGTSVNTASRDAIGLITSIEVDPDLVSSDSVGATLAARAIKRLRRDRAQGFIEAPMNVGQEVWDVVTVADSRSGQTFSGRVSQVNRIYEPGTYRISIGMGAVQSVPRLIGTIESSPGGADRDFTQEDLPPTQGGDEGSFMDPPPAVEIGLTGPTREELDLIFAADLAAMEAFKESQFSGEAGRKEGDRVKFTLPPTPDTTTASQIGDTIVPLADTGLFISTVTPSGITKRLMSDINIDSLNLDVLTMLLLLPQSPTFKGGESPGRSGNTGGRSFFDTGSSSFKKSSKKKSSKKKSGTFGGESTDRSQGTLPPPPIETPPPTESKFTFTQQRDPADFLSRSSSFGGDASNRSVVTPTPPKKTFRRRRRGGGGK